MKLVILSVGTIRDQHLKALAAQYLVRLAPFCRVEERTVKVAPLSDSPTAGEIRAALDKEAAAMLPLLAEWKNAFKIALCVEGEELSSEKFAALIEEKQQVTGDFVFCIGSSYGLSESVKSACAKRLSFSKMTLPHELCKVVLHEQLFRAFSILRKSKYHK